jgi:hypothetical protein
MNSRTKSELRSRRFVARPEVALVAFALAVSLGACGDDNQSEGTDQAPEAATDATEGPPASSAETSRTDVDDTVSLEATEAREGIYPTKYFRTPLDIAVPDWLDPDPQEDATNFVTWVSPDGTRALRVLHPVEVYPPGSTKPTAPPEEFEQYVLGQAESGVTLTDQVDAKVDGRPALVLTVNAPEDVNGSLGCPEAGLPADACFGPGTEFALRLAITETDAGPLLIWLRVAADADLTAEARHFAEVLAGIRFADRQPQVEVSTATPYDGEYTWTITAEHAEAHDPFYESPASYPWIFSLVLDGGALTMEVVSVGFPVETYRGTYDVVGDQITFHLGDGDSTYALVRDPDGTVHATAIPPVHDEGAAYVITTKAWTPTR